MKQAQHTNPDGTIVTIWLGNYATIGNRAIIGVGATIGDYAKRSAVRSDGYVFTVGERDGELRVFAGCRDFNLAEARKHWGAKHPKGKESRNILNFLFGE